MKRYPGQIPDDLVRQFPGWEWTAAANPSFTMWDYRATQCGLEQILAAAHLFWPELVEVDGMVFFAGAYTPSAVERLETKWGKDKQRIERWINRNMLVDFFGGEARFAPTSALDSQELMLLFGNTLQLFWSQRLQSVFPSRRFVVELSEAKKAMLDGSITFYEEP